jgi:hypothetical protein
MPDGADRLYRLSAGSTFMKTALYIGTIIALACLQFGVANVSAAERPLYGLLTIRDLCDYACVSEGYYSGGFDNDFQIGDQFILDLTYDDSIVGPLGRFNDKGHLSDVISRVGGAGTYDPSGQFVYKSSRIVGSRSFLYFGAGDLPSFHITYYGDMEPFRTIILFRSNQPALVTFEYYVEESSLGQFSVVGTLVPIPEPGTLVLGSMALAGYLFRRNR